MVPLFDTLFGRRRSLRRFDYLALDDGGAGIALTPEPGLLLRFEDFLDAIALRHH